MRQRAVRLVQHPRAPIACCDGGRSAADLHAVDDAARAGIDHRDLVHAERRLRCRRVAAAPARADEDGELFRQKTGVEITHVPYKGGAPALNDVMGGQVPMFFANMASSLAHIQGGKLRALAITGAARSPALPGVPTMAEAGVPGYVVYEWNAVFAPAGTPAPAVARIADAIARALQAPEARSRIAALGGEIAGYGPAEAERFVREQTQLWGRVVREAHIKVE